MAERKSSGGKTGKPGAYFGVPLPVWVIVCLTCGLLVGMLAAGNRVTAAIYSSGTIFPKAVVTFATLLVFTLLSGATAKLVLFHREAAGRLFGLLIAAYVVLCLASLAYVTIWISILTKIPLTTPGVVTSGAGQWLRQVGRSFSSLFSEQPLTQVLIVAVIIGYVAAIVPALRSAARGLIISGQATLWLFQKLLWYYPLMIGCLAIGIPLKFGAKGMAAYGQTTLWVGAVTVSWSVILAVLVKLTTKRSLKQIVSYYASVWPTGFGTGGSYETLAMNVVSAESDLGLPREMAEVSIVFGTVMNKSCAGMSVMLVTISVARLMHFSISLAEILTLIPPVLILSLESPGIPGGAAFFMSPIVAALLHVQDIGGFVATFVTLYSGLIPMFSTAGNTTNDGLVGAVLNDWFSKYLKLGEPTLSGIANVSVSFTRRIRPLSLAGFIGWIMMAAGAWMLFSPQALLGLDELKWIHKYAFSGEVVLGALLTTVSLGLLAPARSPDLAGRELQERRQKPEPSDGKTSLT